MEGGKGLRQTMKSRERLPSERLNPQRQLADQSVDPVSTMRILEYFENTITPTYKLSRSAQGWQRLLGYFRNKHTEISTRRQWSLLPTHVEDATSNSPLNIEFLYRKNIDLRVCDLSVDKVQAYTESMRNFERTRPCLTKVDTLEDIFLHCDPEDLEIPNTFVRSGLPRWPYPEVNMMTFINRDDHHARLEAIKKLSGMEKFSNISPDVGLCDTVKNDLKWRSKVLNEKLDFWGMVNADFPIPVSEKICLRQDIGPLSGRATSTDFAKQALSKHTQFSKSSLVLSKLRAFNRADGFLLTFANTSGIDYLTKDFEMLTEHPGYDMLYHHDASVIAHTMHAFQHSGTRDWKCNYKERVAVWLIVYLFTEAAVTPHNIRGGRNAAEILDAYMEASTLKKKKDQPWALGQSPIIVREYQQYIEEIKTIESITSDNLRVLENMLVDIRELEDTKCSHAQCTSSSHSRIKEEAEDNSQWKPESMTERLNWATALLKEREADLRRINSHFDKALKNLLDICIMEQNDRSVVADTMNKAILLFTGITVVFLPLSFVTSYLGMNLTDIRETTIDQAWFWKYLGSTGLVISVASLLFTSKFQFRSFWLLARKEQTGI
ncbi:hypothetical protein GGS24DRAFT_498897 [Hypoxylon argillaceum]|nr:hypothetical protein GGS24DRAFT_498897 [Hypoxylon argillaceum]